VGQVVTVFGGTGFLGRRVVRHLGVKGFSVRVASRHPRPSSGDHPEVETVFADVRERPSIRTAVEGAFGVVNAVSLYVERGTETFQAVHVAAADQVAREARNDHCTMDVTGPLMSHAACCDSRERSRPRCEDIHIMSAGSISV
jgi:uncharacterized protein YbjT (DUF2867 family)